MRSVFVVVACVLAAGCSRWQMGHPMVSETHPEADVYPTETLPVQVDKVHTLATLAYKGEDFWPECMMKLDQEADKRKQQGCDGERATNRLKAVRALARTNCDSTDQHWEPCFATLRGLPL